MSAQVTTATNSRDALDFFSTPGWAVRAVLPHIPLSGHVLEPGAGDGSIIRVLIAHGVLPRSIRGIEVDNGRAVECAASTGVIVHARDFLAGVPARVADTIVCNPPFVHAEAFVRTALKSIRPGGTVAMLLRLAFLESQERVALHREHPGDVLVFPRRPSFMPNGRTDSAAMAWFVWGPGRGGRWQILDVEPREPRGAK